MLICHFSCHLVRLVYENRFNRYIIWVQEAGLCHVEIAQETGRCKSHQVRESLVDQSTSLQFSSYRLKWAINQQLIHTAVNSFEELGPAIRQTLSHRSIKGKFEGVSPLLKEHGYSRVIVTDRGFMFISVKDGNDKY